MAQLDQPDRPITAAVEVGGEVAQDSIRVFIAFIDKCGKIALRVEHEAPSSWTLIGGGAGGKTACVLPRASRRPGGEPKSGADHRGGKPRWSLSFDQRASLMT